MLHETGAKEGSLVQRLFEDASSDGEAEGEGTTPRDSCDISGLFFLTLR